jgi:hypothetical protein
VLSAGTVLGTTLPVVSLSASIVILTSPIVILSEAKDLGGGNLVPPQSFALRSSHSGFSVSINAIFFARVQPLICFSLSIAGLTSAKVSQ